MGVVVEVMDGYGNVKNKVADMHLSMAYDFLGLYVSEKDSDDDAHHFHEFTFDGVTTVKRRGHYFRFTNTQH